MTDTRERTADVRFPGDEGVTAYVSKEGNKNKPTLHLNPRCRHLNRKGIDAENVKEANLDAWPPAHREWCPRCAAEMRGDDA